MRRKFGQIINNLAIKDKKIVMEFSMILEKIIQIDFLIWEFVNKV